MSLDIIDDLFSGNIRPADEPLPSSDEFQTARKVSSAIEDKLEQTLSAEQKEDWNAFLNSRLALTDEYCRAFYRKGLICGIKLMMAVFQDQS